MSDYRLSSENLCQLGHSDWDLPPSWFLPQWPKSVPHGCLALTSQSGDKIILWHAMSSLAALNLERESSSCICKMGRVLFTCLPMGEASDLGLEVFGPHSRWAGSFRS